MLARVSVVELGQRYGGDYPELSVREAARKNSFGDGWPQSRLQRPQGVVPNGCRPAMLFLLSPVFWREARKQMSALSNKPFELTLPRCALQRSSRAR